MRKKYDLLNEPSAAGFQSLPAPLFWAGSLPILLGIFLFLSSCSSESRVETKPQALFPVTVASVTKKSVPLQVRAIGNVEAYSVVSVKSQVGGELAKVHFREGQDVRKGDLLFSIDPRPFEAALRQAEANLARDMAQVKQAEANLDQNLAQVKQAEANLARDLALEQNAEKEAQRYKDLVEKEYVSKEQFDQVLTAAMPPGRRSRPTRRPWKMHRRGSRLPGQLWKMLVPRSRPPAPPWKTRRSSWNTAPSVRP